MPPRCVLNDLQTSPIPRELSVLDELSKQLSEGFSNCSQVGHLHKQGAILQFA